MLEWGGPSNLPPDRVPYNGNFLYRPVASNEWAPLVPFLADASVLLNRALGFAETESLGTRYRLQKFVLFCKSCGFREVDLRQLFQLESVVLAFLVAMLVQLLLWLGSLISKVGTETAA